MTQRSNGSIGVIEQLQTDGVLITGRPNSPTRTNHKNPKNESIVIKLFFFFFEFIISFLAIYSPSRVLVSGGCWSDAKPTAMPLRPWPCWFPLAVHSYAHHFFCYYYDPSIFIWRRLNMCRHATTSSTLASLHSIFERGRLMSSATTVVSCRVLLFLFP